MSETTLSTILRITLQLVSLAPTLIPAVERALADFKKLFSDGYTPTQQDIDDIVSDIETQSAEIQAL